VPQALTSAQLYAHLRPGIEVYVPGCAGHSLLFERWLTQAPEHSAGVRYTGVHIPTVNRFAFAGLHPQARQRGIFLSQELRDAWQQGRFDYLPISYSAAWHWLQNVASFDVALLQVAPPDAEGNCSLGVACDFSSAAWPRARKVFAHINSSMPRSDGPSIPWARIDAAIECDTPLLEVPAAPADAVMDAVAMRVASLIPEHATVQLGLGRLQSSVLGALNNRRGLRLHAGMVSDGLLALIDSGALADAADAVVAGVALGSVALYRAAADRVRFRPVGSTHDHANLRAVPRLHAINSALSVDLLGQVNGECIAGKQISGVGGLPDFQRGARAAVEGRAIIALPSCAHDGASRIVPLLSAGPISSARVDADIIVSEYGSADLRYLDVHARAQALISIAAPQHRETLAREWHALVKKL
jgi:acyl-CoA hydrolase